MGKFVNEKSLMHYNETKKQWCIHYFLLPMLVLVLWSTTYICINIGLGTSQPSKPFSVGGLALFRNIVSSVTLLLLMVSKFRRKNQSRDLKKTISFMDVFYLLILGVCGFAFYNLALNYSQSLVSASVVGFVAGQIPLLVAIMAYFIFKEKISYYSWLGIAIGTIGLLFVLLNGNIEVILAEHFIYGFFLLFCSACYILIQKKLLQKISPLKLISYAVWIGTVALLPFMSQLISELSGASWSVILIIIYLGALPGAIADVLWAHVLSYMPVNRAMVFFYMFPFLTMLLAAWMLNEKPTGLLVFGGAVAFVGALVFNFNHEPQEVC